jgi:hypothetical protein
MRRAARGAIPTLGRIKGNRAVVLLGFAATKTGTPTDLFGAEKSPCCLNTGGLKAAGQVDHPQKGKDRPFHDSRSPPNACNIYLSLPKIISARSEDADSARYDTMN